MNKIPNGKGFTLIELLVVVAIIGILSAVAIPQFSAYRINAFNSAALSDIKNTKTAEESLFYGNQTYGWSEVNVLLSTVVGTGGTGKILTGPVPPASVVAGAALAGKNTAGSPIGVGIGISNNVVLVASTIAANTTVVYVLVAKHTAGTRVYAAESASTYVNYVQSDAWSGIPLSAATGTPASGVPPTATSTPSIISGITSGGGVPYARWQAL